jgi:uncharacterized protein (TIGR00251 family)
LKTFSAIVERRNMPDALIAVRVTPRSARDEVIGWRDGALRVRLRAPPVEGKANEALRRLLAERLGVTASAVSIVSGDTGRLKRVRVERMDEAEVRRRL